MSSFKDTRPKTQRPAGLANQQKKQRPQPYYPRYVEPAPEVKHLSEQVKADLEIGSVATFNCHMSSTYDWNLRKEMMIIFRRRFVDGVDFETCSVEYLDEVKTYFFRFNYNDDSNDLSGILRRRFPGYRSTYYDH